MAIVFNREKLDLLETRELHYLNIGGRVRAPLIAKFQVHGSDTKFFFVVNHLYRSSEAGREAQSIGLNKWAKGETLPIIAVGDFNYDWEVNGGDTNHDDGYDRLTDGDVFKWVRPATLVRTQTNTRYNSVLDFVFVAHDAKNWSGESRILKNFDCTGPTDDLQKTDHFPVIAKFDLPD